MADYRTILENDYPGADAFTQSCLDPVFGPVKRANRSLNLSDVDKTTAKRIIAKQKLLLGIFTSIYNKFNTFTANIQDLNIGTCPQIRT